MCPATGFVLFAFGGGIVLALGIFVFGIIKDRYSGLKRKKPHNPLLDD